MMDPSVKTTIEQRLVETGEKERLKEHLRFRRAFFNFRPYFTHFFVQKSTDRVRLEGGAETSRKGGLKKINYSPNLRLD